MEVILPYSQAILDKNSQNSRIPGIPRGDRVGRGGVVGWNITNILDNGRAIWLSMMGLTGGREVGTRVGTDLNCPHRRLIITRP